MNIGYSLNEINLRGTTNAIFDYAYYNQKLLGNRSIIISDKNHPDLNQEKLKQFQSEFHVELYDNFNNEIDGIVNKHKLDTIFYIKGGWADKKLCSNTKNLVQAVFRINEPHGDKYFYNSKWLGDYMGNKPYLDHICKPLPKHDLNYRKKLDIPEDAIVYGYHGGKDSLDIKFVHKVIEDITKENNNIYFLFMNINKFCDDNKKIIHLPATTNLFEKSTFINTCTVMIHARSQGETFGLSIAEFSMANKPVITYALSEEQNHIMCLGEFGYYYSNYNDLYYLLNNFRDIHNPDRNYDRYSEKFSPEIVMNKFKEILTQ